MIIRMPINVSGRGAPPVTSLSLLRGFLWGTALCIAGNSATAQGPAWEAAERPAAMVVVQPPPPPRPDGGGAVLPTPELPAGNAVQLAPLLPGPVEEVAPIPAESRPRSTVRRDSARSDSVRRRLPAEFRSIGELTASSQIGTSNAQAEVTAADRPEDLLPEQEPVFIASDRIYTRWTPASPLQSVSVHQPLYFEDVNLERYGTTARPRLQPIGSAAHFLVSAASLPYQMVQQRPTQPYHYSHPYESGRYGYRERTHRPCDRRAALVQATVIVGLVFLLP